MQSWMLKFGASAAALTFLLTLGTVSSNAADVSGIPQMSEAPAKSTLIYIDEGVRNWELGQRNSHADIKGFIEKYPCENGFEAGSVCDFSTSKYGPSFEQILRVCEDETAEDCVSSLNLSLQDGEMIGFAHTGYAGGMEFSAIPSQGLYESKTPSLWVGTTSKGERIHLVVTVKTYLSYDAGSKKFRTDRMLASISAYDRVEGSQYFAPYSKGFIDELGRGNMGSTAPDDPSCVWFGDGECGRAKPLPVDASLTLELHISNKLSGWLRGRLKDPEISIEQFSATNQILKVKAQPAEVAVVGGFATAENTTAKGIDAIENWSQPKVEAFSGTKRFEEASTQRAFDFLEIFRKTLGDTAYATKALWTFSSLDSRFISGNKCLQSQSKLVGLVTTNASVYDGGIPSFGDGYLSYRVAGLHYAPDGQDLNKGTYDLIMDASAARCLYGYSKAPVSATVQVVGAGAENIATTVVSEKDGWLKLAAYGFTFSEKQIKVKVTQPQNKTLTKFTGTTKSLTSKQKAEIKTVVTKAKGNPKFICTGVYVNAKDKVTALKRARAACDYAKSLDKDHSYWAQAKQSKAKSYDAKVMIVSK